LFGPGGASNYYTYDVPLTLTAIPEGSTWAMMGLGFVGLAFVGFRKRREPRAIAA
jgi:hypothetical protein